MNARQITKILQKKHEKDLFIPECKDGPTWFADHQRLDAWALKRSWKNPCAWGYEIKVSRSDFVNDTKWRGYLPYCNQFYFVCPHKLIERDELPQEAGLIWISKTGTRAYIKKKAPHRDIELPVDLMRYILFSRVTVKKESPEDNKTEFWSRWLANKEHDRNLGYAVRGRLAEITKKVQAENRDLRSLHKNYKAHRKLLKEMGFEDGYVGEYTLRNKLKNLKGLTELKRSIVTLQSRCEDVLNQIKKEETQPPTPTSGKS